MSFTTMTQNVENITALDDLPNDTGGLTADELKALFDKAGLDIKAYINDILLNELKSTTVSSSGADNIGCETLLTHNNVMDILKAIVAAGTGTIPPDTSITNDKLVDDIKIGSLVDLDTTDKDSVTDAINEIVAKIPTGTIVTTDVSQILTNKTLTSPVLNTGVSGTAIDTDITLAGNSDTKLTSQKATKAYVDNTAIIKSLITAAGDLIYGSAANTPARLPLTTNALLKSNGTAPTWLPFDATANKALISNGSDIVYGYPVSAKYIAGYGEIIATRSNATSIFFGSSYYGTSFTFTANRDGLFIVTFQMKFSNGTNGGYDARINGSTTPTLLSSQQLVLSSTYQSFSMTFNTEGKAGETFSINISGYGGLTIHVQGISIYGTLSTPSNSIT